MRSKMRRVEELTHPVLRIALRVGRTAEDFQRFNSMLRSALKPNVPLEVARMRAINVLEDANDLGIGPDSVRLLKIEWLRLASRKLGGVMLLHQLACAEVQEGGYTIEPAEWLATEVLERDLAPPRLEEWAGWRGQYRMAAVLEVHAARAWSKIVDLACTDLRDSELSGWNEQECYTALRAIAILACFDSEIRGLTTPRARAAFLTGLGASLWEALCSRCEECGEAEMSGARALCHQLTLHVLGHVKPFAQPAQGIEALQSPGSGAMALVVVEPIPPSQDRYDASSLKEFSVLVREPLPVAKAPDASALALVRRTLNTEFPWARDAVHQVLEQLEFSRTLGSIELRLRPLLLVGMPGCGKSRLARRLAEQLGLPFLSVSCAGSHDSKLLSGTARGWASGQPTPLLRVLLAHRRASAFVLLDEIDKAARGAESGPPLTSVLLGLLEPETSRRWRDGFLQASCDLSHIVYCATANGLAAIPKALLSRFDIVHIPEPKPEHMPALVASITREIAREMAVPDGVLPNMPLTSADMGISARELRTRVQKFLADWSKTVLARERLH